MTSAVLLTLAVGSHQYQDGHIDDVGLVVTPGAPGLGLQEVKA